MKKRYLLALGLVAILSILTIWGNQFTESLLNQRLAPLLSEELGLPVTLEPVSVNLLNLRVSTDKLVMGDSTDPAVVAKQVRVRLGWMYLLRGEIRLDAANAADLSLKIDRWPGNDNPWPEDYFFLDQWLPNKLAVKDGRYVYADGSTYPLRDLSWERSLTGGAQVAWTEDRAAGPLTVSLKLHSLKDLLALSDFKADITASSEDVAGSDLSVELVIKTTATTGYALTANAKSDDWKLQFTAGNANSWQWPDHSKTTIDQLNLESIGRVIGLLAREDTQLSAEEFLASPLPALEPIVHSGQIEIGKFSIGDEAVTHSRLEFLSSKQAIEIISLQAAGPRGDLAAAGKLEISPGGWQLESTAKLVAREGDVGIAAEYLDNDWLWHSGSALLSGQGQTWGDLLDSFGGDIKLSGWHRGRERTPVKISGRVDGSAGAFAVVALDIQLGGANITGSATLSGGRERTLQLQLAAQELDLHFLFTEPGREPTPGITIPEYLTALPGIDLHWNIDLQNLDMPGLQLSKVQFKLDRNSEGGELVADALGSSGGRMGVNLAWKIQPGQPTHATMAVTLEAMNLQRTFGQEQGLVDSRSSGKILFTSQGDGVKGLFEGMHGDLNLAMSLRTDSNWERAARIEEEFKVSGTSRLVIQGDHIIGLEISKLDIDAIHQDLTGTVSMVTGRSPWLVGELQSTQLNITELLDWAPESADKADAVDLLDSLRRLGAVRVSLAADTVTWSDMQVSDLALEVDSSVDTFSINKLNFKLKEGVFESRAGLSWKGKQATLTSSGSISRLGLDEFVHLPSDQAAVPLVGTFTLQAEGEKFAELATHLSGSASLKAAPGADQSTPGHRRELEMNIKRLADGVEVELGKLIWGETDLQANVRYHSTTPPKVEIDVHGGSLSLVPWEQSEPDQDKKAAAEAAGVLAKTANTTASMVRRVLSAPSRLLAGDEATAPSDRYFSDQPMNISALKKYDFAVKGELASVGSIMGEARELKFHATVDGGKLKLDASIGSINGGSIEMKMDFDTSLPVPAGQLTSTFNNIYSTPKRDTYPRSGFFDLTSTGSSQAQLAANLDGLAYMEFGRGIMDFRGLAFLTSSVASGVFGALIPGAERQPPEIRCGVVLGQFQQGIGVTPYGYAIRTRRANLIGRVDVDLIKERIELQFDSRSRKGTGLSIGNVFSNTVRLQGPLSNPRIVPNTTSLVWRGWAAVMTAGLSVVGESVLKRALVADTPCENIRREIQKGMCGGDEPVNSPLVCPPTPG